MKHHSIRYKVVTDADGTRRLVCGQWKCGEPVIGARTDFVGAWHDGVHQSDLDAGNFALSTGGGYELQDPGLPF